MVLVERVVVDGTIITATLMLAEEVDLEATPPKRFRFTMRPPKPLLWRLDKEAKDSRELVELVVIPWCLLEQGKWHAPLVEWVVAVTEHKWGLAGLEAMACMQERVALVG